MAAPAGSDYVIMTPLFQERIETNTSEFIDAVFTGSISGDTLTITAVITGSLVAGRYIFGVGIAANTYIVSQLTGTPGGVGTYSISPSPQTITSETISAGASSILRPTKVTVQVDVHGPNSADNTQIITSLIRSDYGVTQFATYGFDVTPLHCNEPKQMPFLNGEQQIEYRWTFEVVMQSNPVLVVSQDAASVVTVTPINVDAAYHP